MITVDRDRQKNHDSSNYKIIINIQLPVIARQNSKVEKSISAAL